MEVKALLNPKTPERVKEIEINIIINLKNDTNYGIKRNTIKICLRTIH